MKPMKPHQIDAAGLADGTYGLHVVGGKVVDLLPTGGGSLTVQDENGNVATGVTQFDFQGAGVSAAAGSGEVVVTIPGGSGGSGGRTLLQKTALTADAASFSFASIPTVHEHLEIELVARSPASSTTDPLLLTLNGDATDANYLSKFFYGSSTPSTGYESTANRRVAYIGGSGTLANAPSIARVRIPGYLGTAFHKHTTAEWSVLSTTSTGYRGLAALLWKNTAAVNALTLSLSSGLNFPAGSTAWLYGLA